MATSAASTSTATPATSTVSPTFSVPLLTENATISHLSEGADPFVPIPGMEEASLKIFQSQVLLPFSLSNGSMHAFLGPFSNPSRKKPHNDLLPEDDSTLPFVYSPTIDLSLFSDVARMFRAFPPPKDKHIQWLERVEASKQSIWKEAGIFDFVQLSKTGKPVLSNFLVVFVFDPQMLLSAIFFWNRETRAFEFPCGFVEMVEIWMGFLSWDLIFTGMKQRDGRVYPYQPQIFARQFGLCQLRPTPLFPKDRIDSDVCVEDVDYEGFLKFILTPSTQLNLTPCSFLPAFLVSKCYLRWWCDYYTDRMFSFEDFSRRLTNSPFSVHGPKISGIYDNRNIISQFELYYRVCYRPENIF
uniref:Aminotransferase-like plant mobile domain-containing protein n=1 Tax=Cajanus cajan TaxID=3821 RepID=A0A151TZS7_CAJCA|nr:hypothetical protein KK1_005098 [Cajanus cajan]